MTESDEQNDFLMSLIDQIILKLAEDGTHIRVICPKCGTQANLKDRREPNNVPE